MTGLPETQLVTGGLPAAPIVLSMTATRPVSYTVEHTQAPVFDLANPALADALVGDPALFVVDEALWPLYGARLDAYAQANLRAGRIVRLSACESDKSLETVAMLCATAFEAGLPRNGAFVAVGGGTILDTVGFAASIYRRGVAFIRVPTTLVGMIDVGVGIKQAVNFHQKKNGLGSFYPPRCSINDVSFLATLPRRELAAGLAEALKMGLVCDATLFETIERHAFELIESRMRSPQPAANDVLVRAEVAMMRELSVNLYEVELKRLVDFGHSFSPVIETASNYAVAHGEAVALDMLLSTAIAAGRKLCEPALIARLVRLYAQLGLPVAHATLSPLLMERALTDARAHRAGNLNLVVPAGIGSARFLQDVSYDELVEALDSVAVAAR